MKEIMFDKNGQWTHLETFDDFDNGLSELIDLWSSNSKTAAKESALAYFKEDLEAAMLKWTDNKAKSKNYASIGDELAEFEEALNEGIHIAPETDSNAPAVPAKGKKMQ